MNSERAFDLVLFGATGFTGNLVADYLATIAAKQPLRWALAGRSAEKLESVRARLAPSTVSSAPELLVVDAADESAVLNMAQQTRVVITTVGPYARFGEPLVRACAEAATDYVDLTGEPQFADDMHDRYHDLAQHNRAKIVHACGFDSIPHDMGAYFTLQALRARMSEDERNTEAITIEAFVRSHASFSGGTLHSALDIMAGLPGRMRKLKKQRQATPGPRRAAQMRMRITHRKDLGFWAIPFPSIDPEVVVRSAELLPEYGPHFRYGHYLGVKRFSQVAGLLAGASGAFALAQLPPTRALLRQIKSSGEGPDEETRKNSYFRVLFIARGGEHEVHCEVRGGDPGYTETAKMLSEAALCLAFDRDRLPQHFGVVPSAAAFGNALIERLQAAGISFREL